MTASTAGADRRWASALAETEPTSYWLDELPARPDLPPVPGSTTCDLLVVGGGYLGLWTALEAVRRQPGRDVLVVEAATCGHAASGRNGGFADPSLTHGWGNGVSRWPDEMATLRWLGLENLASIERFVVERQIDCRFERTGVLGVATRPHELVELKEEHEARAAAGEGTELLDAEQVRTRVDSPTYLGGLVDSVPALVEPARLADGLRTACLDAGVRVHEHSPATGLRRSGAGVQVDTPQSTVLAGEVVLATNAYRPLLRRLRLMTVPVYDYTLVTEPLTDAQRDSIGWRGREGVGDASNLFHYYRLTRDDRILWGGYDAVYHYGSRQARALEHRAETFELLAEQFFTTFPQLAGLRFSHAWGGVIDTSTQFCAFYGTIWGRRVGWAAGFTGLGVASTKFAADVVLDLLAGADTERTRLSMVRKNPLPFPPEPLRWLGIEATRRSMAGADRTGRRNLWLRTLDRLGLGFDS